ncbi:hypothetical protein FACS1894218_3870 [Bacilli bacterium]|nr:hypothetical protein FACS1894218_3870 [Bacilli bacterium]
MQRKDNINVRKRFPPIKFPIALENKWSGPNTLVNELVNSGNEETKATNVPATNAPENLVRLPNVSTT